MKNDLHKFFSSSDVPPKSSRPVRVATSMLNSSFATGNAAAGGGYNPLYSLGGPRPVQLALMVIC
jgi:hypothetical protein